MKEIELLWLIFTTLVLVGVLIISIISAPYLSKYFASKKTKKSLKVGDTSQVRMIHQLSEAVLELSQNKIGAIITIVRSKNIDEFRADGIKIDANIAATLIVAIFQKESPLHDGALVIEGNKMTYAATYYRITSKSVSNKYGARHRAAIGISENSDALTIVVSEETGLISFTINGKIVVAKPAEFQEKLSDYLKV